ncbi:aldehyde dehydrogenase (NAD+) [Filimonas zeae]|uniref:aldehyde dehydrogenase (NAD(+)) n=1 Tax=Filimonas zeae TaxID=1737353 RepID=A0A917J166_9BACT|nr:aldehyde dehydrogenase family protein [Filimonas zeae]MDR6340145.1 aldehyde dehydrogenase (NAD+) [Filimonas zeae]GGH71357.1 aldehyde dehydrogenase [Filimonas zeae]
MKTIDKIYINGAFVTPHGTEVFDLINPTTNQVSGQVVLGDATDAQQAIGAAKAAFPAFSQTTKQQRITYLQQLHHAVARRKEEMIQTMIDEYGGTRAFATMSFGFTLQSFLHTIEVLEAFPFERATGRSTVRLEALGVAGIITPWNASNSFVASKLATAIAAGCTTVVKPSEMSARQTQLLTEAIHEAGLPAGVYNMVNGLGHVVGAEISRSKDVAKISFTGSTMVGKSIAREATETMKRVTLELGGKSPNILLDDADFSKAIPKAIQVAYMNNGQACIAGSRLLVPESRLEEVKALVKEAVNHVKVGNPSDADTLVGPMVSRKQYDRVQQYIQLGIEAGAELLAGGAGHPEGLEAGNFVKPTVFAGVTNDMRIAREEIFGPVLSIITYRTDEEAIEIANDTDYGLHAYISSASTERARKMATRINAGRVAINDFSHDPMAPFGGFKQSGIGREYGVYGLEAYLEPKTIL